MVGQGHHTLWRRGLGAGRATMGCGPLVAHLWLPFWIPPSSGKIGTSRCFPGIADLQIYGILRVLFLAEFRFRQLILQ